MLWRKNLPDMLSRLSRTLENAQNEEVKKENLTLIGIFREELKGERGWATNIALERG